MRSSSFPIDFDVVAVPTKFDRAQVAVRLVLMIMLAHIGTTLGWVFWCLYLVLPVAAAILVSQHGASRYLSEDAHGITRLLRWVVAVYAYLLMLTDRFPTTPDDPAIRFEIRPQGEPRVGSAVLRLVTTLPMAFGVMLIGIISTLLWLASMVLVLAHREFPRSFYDFQIGAVRFLARLWGYHASLVQTYPPVTFESGRMAATV